MAEKEEIIFIDLIKGGCAKCPHEYGNCERCYYRQEAIDRMGGAIHRYEYEHTSHFPTWCELNDDIKNDYRNMAEAALNALLE